MSLCLLLVAMLTLIFTAARLHAAKDIVLFDFEKNDALVDWQNDDGAFRLAGKDAPYYKVKVQNAQGERFLFSLGLDKPHNALVGSITSPVFIIERDYINFRLGGDRSWPEHLGAQLLVEGEVVRSSTGNETIPSLSFNMLPLNWNVKAYKGKKARILINDFTPYGSIGTDHFVMSDTPVGWRSDATVRYAEMYRPAFHATAPTGRTQDANGLFYYKGLWHLGYQLRYTDGGGTSWGHSVSRDLIHWEARGEMVPVGLTCIAISGGATIDHLNISGLKKGDDDPILLTYTVVPPGVSMANPETPYSKVRKAGDAHYYPALAYSTDGGRTWTKTLEPLLQYGNPEMLTYDKANAYTLDGGKTWVRDPTPLLGPGGFKKDRDAKVIWFEPTKDWIMIWHLSQNNTRNVTSFGLYRSKDLKKWELFQTIPQGWECPDMFEMPVMDKNGIPTGQRYWVINRGGAEYWVGTFDGKQFVPMSINDSVNPYEFMTFDNPAYTPSRFMRRVMYRSGYYAAQNFTNAPDNRQIQMAWPGRGKRDENTPGSPFDGQLTFPMELTLRDTGNGIVLEHMPVREIESIYSKRHTRANITLSEGVSKNLVPLSSNLLDIDVTLAAGDAREFGLEIHGEKILYDTKDNRLRAFRDYDQTTSQWVEKSTPVVLQDGKISLRILVDRMSIEVCINNGVYITTAIIYPQDDFVDLGFISEGGRAMIERLVVNEIECDPSNIHRRAETAPCNLSP